MATSYLYVRTDSSTKFGAGGVLDPANLDSTQLLPFTQPNRVLEGITENYENIVTQQVSVNQSGLRRMFLRDDGLKGRSFIITGVLDKTPKDVGVNKIMKFRTDLMRTTLHPHGRVGFLSGNSTNFSIDPDANAETDTPANLGLMIGDTVIGYSGRIIKRLSFRMTLIFGGTHETVPVV